MGRGLKVATPLESFERTPRKRMLHKRVFSGFAGAVLGLLVVFMAGAAVLVALGAATRGRPDPWVAVGVVALFGGMALGFAWPTLVFLRFALGKEGDVSIVPSVRGPVWFERLLLRGRLVLWGAFAATMTVGGSLIGPLWGAAFAVGVPFILRDELNAAARAWSKASRWPDTAHIDRDELVLPASSLGALVSDGTWRRIGRFGVVAAEESPGGKLTFYLARARGKPEVAVLLRKEPSPWTSDLETERYGQVLEWARSLPDPRFGF